MRLKNKGLAKILLILPMFLALVISPKTLDRQVVIRYVLLGLILFTVSMILMINQKEFKTFTVKQIRIFFIVFCIFILIGGISLFYTNNYSDGLFTLTRLLLAGIYLTYILYTFRTPETLIKCFTKSIVVLGFIICLIGFYQLSLYFREGMSNSSLYTITGTSGNKNLFAQYLFFIFPFIVYVALSENRFWKISATIISVSIIVFITLLMTRSVWVAFILSLFFTLGTGFYFRVFNIKNYRKTTMFFLITIVLVLCIIMLYSKYDDYSAFSKQITGYGTEKGRLVLWQNSLDMFREAPLFGRGLGSWKIEILKHANLEVLSDDNLVFYQRPHNDFIWILCELGIIGCATYIIIFIYTFYLCISLLKSNIKSSDKHFILSLVFALIGYIIVSFFSFPIDRMEHIIFLAFVLGAIISLFNYYNKPEKGIKVLIPKTLLLSFSTIILFSLFLGGKRYYSEVHLKKAFNYRTQKNWRSVVANTKKANSAFYRIDMFSTPVEWYQGLAHFNLKNYHEAYRNFKSAYSVNPYHIHVLNDLASCSSVLGKQEKSLVLYKKALSISPDFEEALYNISTIYYQKQDLDNAFYYFSKIENTDSEKYNKYMRVIVYPKIQDLMKPTLDIDTKNAIRKYINSPENIKNTIRKTSTKEIKFEQQLMIDLKMNCPGL